MAAGNGKQRKKPVVKKQDTASTVNKRKRSDTASTINKRKRGKQGRLA